MSASGITVKAKMKRSLLDHTVGCDIKHKCAYVLKMYVPKNIHQSERLYIFLKRKFHILKVLFSTEYIIKFSLFTSPGSVNTFRD